MYEHVLVATDGSEHAATAVEHAVEVADRYGATLHALYVIETRTAYDNAIVHPDEVHANLRQAGENALEEVEQLAARRDVPVVPTVDEGVPPERILAYVDENDVDFVFMGERGRSAFKTVLLGSTAERVLYEADVPVALV